MTTEPISVDELDRRQMREVRDKLADALIDTTDVDQAIAYHERSIRTIEGCPECGGSGNEARSWEQPERCTVCNGTGTIGRPE